MPVDDHRIERALEAAAPVVDTARVLDRVATKRVRRRRARRLASATSVLAIVAVLVVTTVLVTRDDTSSPQIAAPGARLTARVIRGDHAVIGDAGRLESPVPVELDADPGQLRGPLVVGSKGLSVASYDGSEPGLVPSHIVRIDGGHLVDVVDFKAEVISIAEGEGARWAVTRNRGATSGVFPDSFLKRIAADGTATSVPLPVDAYPVGSVAAFGGAVWVPTQSGLEQFDTNGNHVRTITLRPANARSVAAIGKSAWVTDRDGLIRLDPTVGATSDTRQPQGLPAPQLAAGDFGNGWLLASRVTVVGPDLQIQGTIALPSAFTPATIAVADGRVWVTGTVGNHPAIVLLGGERVRATVVVQTGHNVELAWTSPDTVTAVTDGRLVRIRVP
jgi:hypothetical protein